MTLLQWVLASAAVGAGACIQGSIGFGLNLVAAPVLLMVDTTLVPGPAIFLGLVLFIVNPENMIRFIQAPLGRVMMLVALVLQPLGYLWIRKIIQIEV